MIRRPDPPPPSTNAIFEKKNPHQWAHQSSQRLAGSSLPDATAAREIQQVGQYGSCTRKY